MPGEIKLSEIIQLLEGSMAPVECLNNPDICDRSGSCATQDLWSEIKQAIDGVLDAVTLQDLVERQKRKEQIKELMYYI
jgi:DNA-binding IscR family transcriptional regulator